MTHAASVALGSDASTSGPRETVLDEQYSNTVARFEYTWTLCRTWAVDVQACSSVIVETTKGVCNPLYDHQSMSTCSNFQGVARVAFQSSLDSTTQKCFKPRFFVVTGTSGFEHLRLWKNFEIPGQMMDEGNCSRMACCINECHFSLGSFSFMSRCAKWLRAEATQLAHDHLNRMLPYSQLMGSALKTVSHLFGKKTHN